MPPLEQQELNNAHAQELDDVIGQLPKGFTRWGNAVFLFILLAVTVISYFVQYADKIASDFVLSTVSAPKTVLANTEGKLQKLFVKENDWVKEGAVAGLLESDASYDEVKRLSSELCRIWSTIQADQWETVPEKMLTSFNQLGELQSVYQTFVSEFLQLRSFLKNGLIPQKKAAISHELNNLSELKENLFDQQTIYEQDFVIDSSAFEVKKRLFDSSLITPLEYNQERSKNIKIRLPLQNIHAAIISNNTSIHSKKQELVQLDLECTNQKVKFLQALNSMIGRIKEWEKKYLLIAPTEGKIIFPVLLQEKQDVKTGQELMFISPPSEEYFGEMTVEQNNVGKLVSGQETILSLQGFPREEYGVLKGQVKFIAAVPNSKQQYYVAIALENGLKTDRRLLISYKNGLTGRAEIIIGKTRLLNKLLFTLRNMTQ